MAFNGSSCDTVGPHNKRLCTGQNNGSNDNNNNTNGNGAGDVEMKGLLRVSL